MEELGKISSVVESIDETMLAIERDATLAEETWVAKVERWSGVGPDEWQYVVSVIHHAFNSHEGEDIRQLARDEVRQFVRGSQDGES